MALASKKHNFIFIHIYKCGGNSIRRFLGTPNIGQQDVNMIESFEIHGVHTNIADVKAHLDSNDDTNFYQNAYKFSVVRNPYSHLVSLYRYIRFSKIHQYHNIIISKNFHQYLQWYVHESMHYDKPYGANKHQFMHEFLSIDGNIEMDFVARLENINEDMKIVANVLGFPAIEVPMINRFDDRRRIPWQSYYDTQCKEFVSEHFSKDFDIFGYSKEIK